MDSEAEVEVEVLVGEVVVEEGGEVEEVGRVASSAGNRDTFLESVPKEVEVAEEGDSEGKGVEADSRGTQVEDAVFVRNEICSDHW